MAAWPILSLGHLKVVLACRWMGATAAMWAGRAFITQTVTCSGILGLDEVYACFSLQHFNEDCFEVFTQYSTFTIKLSLVQWTEVGS